jgi:3'(2'), 5'-bisphosphate nucleotidase
VHVALAVDGVCALGAVALPSQGRVFYGVAQGGSERAGVEGEGAPELMGGDTPAAAAPRIAVSRSHTPEWVERFADAMDGTLAPAGSAGNKVAMLLSGEADVYVHKIGLKEWDTCAPETIARSLGWHVCRLDGTPHVYNRPDPRNHELVVCRPAVKDRVLAALSEAGALEDRKVR